jgi:hypothetical protein
MEQEDILEDALFHQSGISETDRIDRLLSHAKSADSLRLIPASLKIHSFVCVDKTPILTLGGTETKAFLKIISFFLHKKYLTLERLEAEGHEGKSARLPSLPLISLKRIVNSPKILFIQKDFLQAHSEITEILKSYIQQLESISTDVIFILAETSEKALPTHGVDLESLTRAGGIVHKNDALKTVNSSTLLIEGALDSIIRQHNISLTVRQGSLPSLSNKIDVLDKAGTLSPATLDGLNLLRAVRNSLAHSSWNNLESANKNTENHLRRFVAHTYLCMPKSKRRGFTNACKGKFSASILFLHESLLAEGKLPPSEGKLEQDIIGNYKSRAQTRWDSLFQW